MTCCLGELKDLFLNALILGSHALEHRVILEEAIQLIDADSFTISGPPLVDLAYKRKQEAG